MATEYELGIDQAGVDYSKELLQNRRVQEKAAKLADRYAKKQQKLGYDTNVTLQQNLSNAVDNQIYTRPDGSLYQLDYMLDDQGVSQGTQEVDYTQLNAFGTPDVRDLYIDDTAEGNYKLGLARTDQGGFAGRYDPAVHPDWETLEGGELAGPRGVTRKDGSLMNITLPRDYATQFEYGVHTQPEQIKNRVIGTGPVTEQDIADFGAGKTEYTTPNAPMWNVDSVDTGLEITDETPMPKEPKYYNKPVATITTPIDKTKSFEQRLEESMTGSGAAKGRAENLVDTLQYGIGRGAASIGDAIIDASTRMVKEGVKYFGDKTEEEANKYIKEDLTFSKGWFNDNMDFTAFDEYKEAKAYGYDNTRTAEAAERFKEAYQSGSVLDMASSVVEGTISAGPEYFLESAAEFIAASSGYGLLPLAGKYSNDMLEEREKITGRPATGLERASMLPLGLLVAGTNKLGADELFSRTGVVDKVVNAAIKSGSESAAKNVVIGVMKAASTVAGKGTYEGLEEIVQESLQKFGEKYGTKAQAELTSSKMGEELFQAFAGGAAGGATISGAGQVAGAVIPASQASTQLMDKLDNYRKSKESKAEDAAQEQDLEALVNTATDSVITAATDVGNGNHAAAFASLEALDLTIDTFPDDIMETKAVKSILAQREQIATAFNEMAKPIVDDVISGDEELTPDTIEKIRALGSTRTPGDGPIDGPDGPIDDQPPVGPAVYNGIVEQAIQDADIDDVTKRKLLAVAAALDVPADVAENSINDTLIVNELRKTMDEVTIEEETGPRGYKTYFANIMKYRRSMDPNGKKLYEKNLDDLSNFAALHTAKIAVIEKTLAQAEAEVSKLVESGVALEDVKNTITKGTTPSGYTFEVNATDAAKKLANPNYEGGMYGVLAADKKAVDGMLALAKKAKLDLNTEQGAQVIQEKKTVADRLLAISNEIKKVQADIRKATSPAAIATLEKKKQALIEQRENIRPETQAEPEVDMAEEPVIEPVVEEEALPTVEEVATKIATGEEITAADEQVQNNEGPAIEAELQRMATPGEQTVEVEAPPGYETAKEIKVAPETAQEIEVPVEIATEYEVAIEAIAALDGRIADIKDVLNGIATEKVAIKNNLKKHSITIAQLSKIVIAKTREVEKLKGDAKNKTALEKVIKAVQRAMEIAGNIITEVKRVIGKFEKEIAADKAKINALDTRIREEVAKLREYKKERRELAETAKSYETKSILEANKSLGNILEVSRNATVLSTNPEGYKLVEGTEEILAVLEKRFMLEQEPSNQYTDSPGRLLMDSNGKFRKNVAAAMRKNINEWLLNNGSYILERNVSRVAGMLGIAEEEVSSEAMSKLGNKVFKKLVANSLGKGILADIGLQGRKDVEDIRVEKMIADVGHIALIAAGDLDLVSPVDANREFLTTTEVATFSNKPTTDTKDTDAKVVLIKILPKGVKYIKNRTNHTTVKELSELLNTEDKAKEVVWKRPKDRVVATDKNEVFDTPDKSQEAINKLEKEEWEFDFGTYDLIMENINYVKSKLDYTSEEDLTKLGKMDRESKEAKNNAIDLGLAHLANLGEDVKEKGNSFFFKWFFSVNGRFFMDNNTANPQTNKVTRFVVGMKKNTVDLKFSDTENMNVFYTAIAQAFDQGIDKNDTAKMIAFGKDHVELSRDELLEAMENGQLDVEDVAHAMQVVTNIGRLQEAKKAGKESFKSNLTLETDAVTSGIMLKMLQMPILGMKKTMEWLTKGGITFGGEARTNSLIAAGKITDAYKTIALKFAGAQDGIVDRAITTASDAGAKFATTTKNAVQEYTKTYKELEAAKTFYTNVTQVQVQLNIGEERARSALAKVDKLSTLLKQQEKALGVNPATLKLIQEGKKFSQSNLDAMVAKSVRLKSKIEKLKISNEKEEELFNAKRKKYEKELNELSTTSQQNGTYENPDIQTKLEKLFSRSVKAYSNTGIESLLKAENDLNQLYKDIKELESLKSVYIVEEGKPKSSISKSKETKIRAVHKLMPELLEDKIDETTGKTVKTVTKAARDLFKPVLMVFGYGGGLAGIIKKFNGETIEALPSAALKELLSDEPGKAVAALVSVNALPSLKGTDTTKYTTAGIEAAIAAIRDTDVLSNISYEVDKNKATAREDLHVNMKLLYGDLITDILTDEFGPIMEANKTINNTTRMMFRMYDVMYQEKLVEFRKEFKRNPSTEDKLKMYIELREFFPAVKAPFSTDESKAIIVGQGLKQGEGKASTLGNFVDAEGKPQSTSAIQGMIKDFEESISSGNVNLIHYLDASILADSILDSSFLPVHDAHVVGVGEAVKANKVYNEGVHKYSTEYSLIDAIYESYTTAYNAMSPKQKAKVEAIEGNQGDVTLDTQLEDLNSLRDQVQSARQEFFSRDMSVDHMTGLEAVVSFKAMEVAKSDIRTEPAVNKVLSTAAVKNTVDKVMVKPEVKQAVTKTKVAQVMWHEKAGTVVFANGAAQTVVNSLAEMRQLANDLHTVITENNRVAEGEQYVKYIDWFNEIFQDIADSGITFTPITVKLMKGNVESSMNSNTNTMTINTGLMANGAYPLKVILHEYAHAITVSTIKNSPAIHERIKAIMARPEVAALRDHPKLGYAFFAKDADSVGFEFMAEVISNPMLQAALQQIPSDKGNSTVFAEIKKLWGRMLQRINGTEVSALTDALELVMPTDAVLGKEPESILDGLSDEGLLGIANTAEETFKYGVNEKLMKKLEEACKE